ncbi:MAG: cytochrome P460 family protein [Armatimonas sp.]
MPTSSGPPDLTGFRKWHRATKEPFQISDVIAARCYMVPADQDFYRRTKLEPPAFKFFPHRGFMVHVYVNDIGKPSMTLDGKPFPEGSIVVKEKFPVGGIDRTSYKPILKAAAVLTVMRKCEKGFAPDTGDWEYFTGDPKSLKLTEPGWKQIADCKSCHMHYKDRDYITKSYLVDEYTYTKLEKSRHRVWSPPGEATPRPH